MCKTQIDKHIKTWGFELWIENSPDYCGKELVIYPNKQCSVHYHKLKKETFYVIEGSLHLQYSDNLTLDFWEKMKPKEIVLNTGDAFTIKPYTAHRFKSSTDHLCRFIEISSQHLESDSYRIIASQ